MLGMCPDTRVFVGLGPLGHITWPVIMMRFRVGVLWATWYQLNLQRGRGQGRPRWWAAMPVRRCPNKNCGRRGSSERPRLAARGV